MTEFQERKFMIFATSELQQINFNEVIETSSETVRKSIDQSKTFVKWESDNIPNCVQNLTTKQGPYSYEEMLQILSGADWNPDFNT